MTAALPGLRVLTVRQPWAWALVHAGKDVENRSRNLAGSYRGLVAIHAGRVWDESVEDPEDPMHGLVFGPCPDADAPQHNRHRCRWCSRIAPEKYGYVGCVIGVVDLVDAHHYHRHAVQCSDRGRDRGRVPAGICSPWAEYGDVWHLCVENSRPLRAPVRARGRLGLWRPDEELAAAIWSQVGEAA